MSLVFPAKPALVAIKGLHTLAWFSIEACMIYLLYAGLARRSDPTSRHRGSGRRWGKYHLRGEWFSVPATSVAERLGAQRGSVTDIYLPKWFAHNLPAIHAPLLVVAALLHRRNLRAQRRRWDEIVATGNASQAKSSGGRGSRRR